jgi:hypothetical protein
MSGHIHGHAALKQTREVTQGDESMPPHFQTLAMSKKSAHERG